MAFRPERITKDHVLSAVTKIEQGNIQLEPSWLWDVLINGKPYPPKEIMRYAHQAMNGEKIWDFTGGDPTNSFLKKLGFEVTKKDQGAVESPEIPLTGNIWKLGCNWGSSAPSFYDFIKEEGIVIGVDKQMYEKGDLVVLTKGFLVSAIAMVLISPDKILNKPEYKRPFKDLEIDYDKHINYASAEWYELNEQDQFEYQLQAGIRKVQDVNVKQSVLNLWNSRKSNYLKENKKVEIRRVMNLILYGPPGTGKTYNSIDKAVQIAAPNAYQEKMHAENKKIFDALRKERQIEFVTFHQNYTYEDFMTGLTPDIKSDELKFERKEGVFKKLVTEARRNWESSSGKATTLESFETVFYRFFKTLIDEEVDSIEIQMRSKGYSFKMTSVDVENGRIKFTKQSGGTGHDLLVRNLKAMYEGSVNYPLEGIWIYYFPLVEKLKESAQKTEVEKPKNYVLVIDEINRANISKVFGELITLLEQDKRLGEDNELIVRLPSGEEFGIPPNLYVIGTMNTADKSIALVDIALRRRFEFEGKYPDYTVIKNEAASGLLKKINKAIFEKKKSADYLIGHAYFMNDLPLKQILQNKVIPLLSEYFLGKADFVTEIFRETGWKVSYNSETYQWDITEQ